MKHESVVAWREALTRLSDQYFFDLLRMYLGAIKTPFNKQRLIEELSAFLRKKATKERIAQSLDDADRAVLAAIREMNTPTQQRIVSLLSPSSSFSAVYERILNLEERLIIYRRDENSARAYAINPLLEDDLAPYATRAALVSPVSRGEPARGALRLDDLALAGLYSFFLLEGESIKNDGSLRKKTLAGVLESFPRFEGDESLAEALVAALRNLGLVGVVDGRLVPDPARWAAFAQCGEAERAAYVAAASTGRFPREELQRGAQAFVDFVYSLESGARYAGDAMGRLAFLSGERLGGSLSPKARTRFAAMIGGESAASPTSGLAQTRDARTARDTPPDFPGIARSLGIILDGGEGTFARNEAFFDGSGQATHAIVVSPSFDVIVFPGLALGSLLPLAAFLEVADIQTAANFTITRRSCSAAFDMGETDATVIKTLSALSRQPLPGNVAFTISDWYRNYSSVSLYHGYVLRVDEGRRAVFEQNEAVAPWIGKTLAPGVYTLAVSSDEDLAELFSRAGLDFAPSVSTPPARPRVSRLPSLALAPAVKEDGEVADGKASADDGLRERTAREALVRELFDAIEAMDVDPDIREALRSRVERKIVLSPEQLDPASVRIEKIEARGMDFLGKVRIAEHAMASGALLEVKLDEKDGPLLLGRPLSTEKRAGDLIVSLVLEGSGEVVSVSLGRAMLVRRIRGSIFSEPTHG